MSERGEQTHKRILDTAERLVMAKGFAGTSVDDILKGANLTKGAFFHHFKSKGDLARELIERNARDDIALFERFASEAEAKSDDPLEQMFLFLEAFEDYANSMPENPPGCIYAAYTYESMQFDPSINDFVADSLRRWTSIYVRKFEDVLARVKPALPVTSRQLGEMIASVVEGGLVFARAYGDPRVTARQSEQFRNYLELLFGGRTSKPAKKASKSKKKRRSAA
jgi:TetR/AcrR family transcriptional repressor of nem operon